MFHGTKKQVGGDAIGRHPHESVDCSQSPASSSSLLGKQQQSYVRTSAIKLIDTYPSHQQRQAGVKRKHDSVIDLPVSYFYIEGKKFD